MMKSKSSTTLFLSDFDGTMSSSEFYLVYVKNYCPNENKKWLHQCINGDLTSFDYLKNVLAHTQVLPHTLEKHIQEFPLDSSIAETVNWLKVENVDFAVTSAGCAGYLHPLLKRLELEDIEIFSNGVEFKDNRMIMTPAPEQFYEPYFGIDKAEVVIHMRNRYDTIIYAGDGSSDFGAAKASDMRFAKGSLAHKLRGANIPFYPFEHYSDILTKLKEEMNFFG